MPLGIFKDQVSSEVFTLDLFPMIGIVAVMMATAGLALIDVGAARAKNSINSVTEKLLAGVFAAVGFIPIGYAIWNWQFNSAFEIPNPLGQAIEDWWIGGNFLTELPQNIDPTILPNADQYVVFYALFVAFAFFGGALVHSSCAERIKPVPLYILAFLTGAVILTFELYLLWGSVSPLTREGVHDDIGGFGVYLPIAAAGAVIAWRLGPRKGAFSQAEGEPIAGATPGPQSIPFIGVGMFIVIANLFLFAIVGGYQVPGSGYFGISFTESGMGLLLTNLFCAMIGGGVAGGILAYRTRNPFWAIGGPLMGYISVTTFNDIGLGWYEFFIGFAAVFVGYWTSLLARRIRLDEEKLVPLVLGPGIFGALAGGFTEWGTKTGGYPGITEGDYAFLGAEVTPWWQLVGVIVAVGGAGLFTLIVCLVLERTTGLRVEDEAEEAGMDQTYWAPAVEPGRPDGR